MLKSFQGYQPRQAFLFVMVIIILWLPLFITKIQIHQLVVFSGSPLFSWFPVSLNSGDWLIKIFSFLFWFFIGYLLLWLNRKYLFLETRTFFPLLFFMMIPPLNGFQYIISPVNLTLPFIILTLDRFISSYRKNAVDSSWFMAGFWIGIATLIWIHSLFFLIIVFAGLFIFRPFYFREWIITILGFLTPWYFSAGIYFLAHMQLHGFWIILHESFKELPTETFIPELFKLLPQFYLLIMILIASLSVIGSFSSIKLMNRKVLQIYFLIFLLALIPAVLKPGSYGVYTGLILLPATILLSKYFSGKIRRFKRIVFDLWLLILFGMEIYTVVAG